MHMLHFGCTTEVNTCIKQLLVSFHGGFLWLDRNISTNIKLIASIKGLPLAGVDPTPFFTGKDQDIVLTNKMKEKYDLAHDTIGFSIASTNDIDVRVVAKFFSSKLLWKM